MIYKYAGVKWDIMKNTLNNHYPLFLEGALVGTALGGLRHVLAQENRKSSLLKDLSTGALIGLGTGAAMIGLRGARNIHKNIMPISNKIFNVPEYYIYNSVNRPQYLLNTIMGALAGGAIGGIDGQSAERALLGGLGGAAIGALGTYIPHSISKYKTLGNISHKFLTPGLNNLKLKIALNPFL